MDHIDRNQAIFIENISKCLSEALDQVCGGGNPGIGTGNNDDNNKTDWKDVISGSISRTNNNKNSTKNVGKPHDIEIRIAQILFHRWKRQGGRKDNNSLIQIVSDLGLVRTVSSPREMGEIICEPLEEICRDRSVTNDVRCNTAGIICIVSFERSMFLQEAGLLRCPNCIRWCKGEKGLWWHQQQSHQKEHSEATSLAVSANLETAIVLYDPNQSNINISDSPQMDKSINSLLSSCEDPLEYIKNGNLPALKVAIKNGYNPSVTLDSKGASPLMWAAGVGNLGMTRYLIEECNCSPTQPQKGKRAFAGRTALHWSARNGCLDIVKYLVSDCEVDIEASTADGTTAFCWAAWQGHIDVMKFLYSAGCNVNSKNSFGCNAVLWCAQGKGDVSTLEWLASVGCGMKSINCNGHSALHKAAQRGQADVCDWLFRCVITKTACDEASLLEILGPDQDGCCPSDLAGMEGFEELAYKVARQEVELASKIIVSKSLSRSNHNDGNDDVDPIVNNWFGNHRPFGVSLIDKSGNLFVWEPWGGVRRINSKLAGENLLKRKN